MTSHLWVLIHKHQSEIQALGPFATLGAALIAAGVAGTFGWLQYRIGRDQRHIAASQRDIAKMKVRMDLHEKRFEIVQAARELMIETRKTTPDKKQGRALRQTLKQSAFFFPAHITVRADQIEEAYVAATWPANENDFSDPRWQKVSEGEERIRRYLDEWPAPFSEVMTFRDVE